MSSVVYKICSRAAWSSASATGALEPSGDDARDGYVHLSTASQLRGTLDRHFAGKRELVLLSVAVNRLPVEQLRWESSRGGQLFPHLYAALRTEHVMDVKELPLSAEGQHLLPETQE